MQSDYIDKVVTAFFKDQEMAETADYLSRGRRFEGFALDQLHEQWVVEYRVTFVDGDLDNQAFNDVRAELRLRERPEPTELVEVEAAALRKRIMADYALAKAEGRAIIDHDSPIMDFMRRLGEPPADAN